MNLKPIQSDDTRIWGPLFLKMMKVMILESLFIYPYFIHRKWQSLRLASVKYESCLHAE